MGFQWRSFFNDICAVKAIVVMAIKIGINGCGRIGKLLVRLLSNSTEFEVVALNDPMPVAVLANLLKYDSQHGKFSEAGAYNNDFIELNGKKVILFQKNRPDEIPWGDVGAECVLESSGMFTTRAALSQHIKAGAKRVVLCQPSADELDCTVVIGVNEQLLNSNRTLISNSSCTTNCIAPLLKVLDTEFGIEKAFFNTVHPYTNNQSLHDGPHADLRRSRAALCNIIPTTSTAVASLHKVMPGLASKIDGFATRVPVPLGAYVELTALLTHDTSVEKLNTLFAEKAQNEMKGIIEYCADPLVSTDIVGNPHSAVFDSLSTKVIGENFVQVLAWYDNETGYSHRVLDLLSLIYSQSDLNV
jgi:glyceraldehyde 3-phosphate dehydrogenase